MWLSLIMVLVWTGAFLLVKTYHDGVAEQLGAVVDELEIPDSWTLVSEQVERERYICFNDRSCPTFSRTWQADRILDPEDVLRLAETAEWDLTFDGTCERDAGAEGMSSVCSASAEVDGYRVNLHIDSADSDSASLLRMSLRFPAATGTVKGDE